MKMNLEEARKECLRWLVYLEQQKQRSIKIQELATKRRGGMDEQEARRQLRAIDRGVIVYDGTKLADAVTFLLDLTEDL